MPTAAQVVGVHFGLPHSPAFPPPPQVSGWTHLPQSSKPPHPSPAGPHFRPIAVHVSGVQPSASLLPHSPGFPPPPQVSGATHLPQSSKAPHPSPAGPHFRPSVAHEVGVHFGLPHSPGLPPPPQVPGGTQVPQSSLPPHPSPAGPQLIASFAQVVGVHVGGGGGRSGVMQEARSKSMNSRTFSCAVSGDALQLAGNVVPEVAEFATWKSLNTTRPHCDAAGEPTGVLKV